jgi:ribonuclease Z|tara:strand:+ start:9874 stop:10794 length:921 start_codon:yes stop_codon:yes gene_type:complete
MSFKLTILGSNSAVPLKNRNPTSQLLNVNERFFLIDCGENTQVQLRKHGLSFQRIHHIFISHLHGDHYYGLIGLINSMHLLGRKKELHIHAHEPLKEIINLHLQAASIDLSFPLFFHTIPYQSETILYQDDVITISNILLDHTIKCSGFIFKEKKYKRKIDKVKIEKYAIHHDHYLPLMNGENYNFEGVEIENEKLTKKPEHFHSYAFCSDTRFLPNLSKQLKKIDVLYHESTFANGLETRANETGHSTTGQAASIAKLAKVKLLITGHYSRRYIDLNILLNETKDIFSNSMLSYSGMSIDFNTIY